jgi:hypothetical protein
MKIRPTEIRSALLSGSGARMAAGAEALARLSSELEVLLASAARFKSSETPRNESQLEGDAARVAKLLEPMGC